MPQSLAQIYVHLVFSTKGRAPLIPAEVAPRLHAYLAGAGQAIECPALVVGGVADHVHLLFRLSKNRALSDAVKELKVESSKWMKEQGVQGFGWQAGYGAFSIGALPWALLSRPFGAAGGAGNHVRANRTVKAQAHITPPALQSPGRLPGCPP